MTKAVVKLARAIHILSAFWVFILGIVIFVDVFGRLLFSHPLEGTKEILQNSVIAVTFLQIPLAIYSGSMLKTTMLVNILPPLGQRLFRTLAFVLGALVFFAIAYSSWTPALDSIRLGEYEGGGGSIQIYTWPIRFTIVGTAIFAMFAYIMMIIADWRGDVGSEDELLSA